MNMIIHFRIFFWRLGFGARGGCQDKSPGDRLDPPLNLPLWRLESMKTRSAVGQTGKAPSNPIN